MLLIPCPWCGERDEIEFRYGGEAGIAYPTDPAALDDERVGGVPLRPRQPEGRVRRALGAHARLPALVRPRPRHRDERDLGRAGCGCRAGGRPDRPVAAIGFEFDGRSIAGFEGDTLASALVRERRRSAASEHLPRPAARRLPAGEEEPNALVQVGGRWRAEPMLRATLVELEDGLGAGPLAGQGPPGSTGGTTRRYDSGHAHCDVLVVGGGRVGLAAAAAARAGRPRSSSAMLAPRRCGRRRAVAATCGCSPTDDRASASTTTAT